MSADAPIIALALFTAVCGLWVLQTAWRAGTQNGIRLGIGWALLLVSTLVWTLTTSIEKGIALGTTAIVVMVLLFLLYRRHAEPPRGNRVGAARHAKPEAQCIATIAGRTLSAVLLGPVAGLAALSLSTAGFVLGNTLGAEHTGNLVVAMFAFPLFWAALAALVAMDSKLWRRAAWIGSTGLAPLTLIMVSG